MNYFFAKFLEILTTGLLEIGKSVQKQSVSIFWATAHARLIRCILYGQQEQFNVNLNYNCTDWELTKLIDIKRQEYANNRDEVSHCQRFHLRLATFRMLQHTSSEVIIFQLQINLNYNCTDWELTKLIDIKRQWKRWQWETSSLLLAYSCRFMSINFVSSQSVQLEFKFICNWKIITSDDVCCNIRNIASLKWKRWLWETSSLLLAYSCRFMSINLM